MIGKISKIQHEDDDPRKPLIVLPKHRVWLEQNIDEKKVDLAKALGVSRPALDRIIAEHLPHLRVPHKKHEAYKIAKRVEKKVKKIEGQLDTKKRQKIVDEVAKEIAKERMSLTERMSKPIKGKDGNPIIYEGEPLDTMAMLDVSLVNMAKDNPNANIALRAQLMKEMNAADISQNLPTRKKVVESIKNKRDRIVAAMLKATKESGQYTTMLDTSIKVWGDAWFAKEVTLHNWLEAGAPSVDIQVTAQAQHVERPSQVYEVYRNSLKAFNDADQKLRSNIKDYSKLINGDNDGDSPLSEFLTRMKNEVGD